MIMSASISSYLPIAMGLVIVGLAMALMYYYNKATTYDRYAHLVTILTECKKTKRPMGIVVDKSGHGHPVIIEQNPKNAGLVRSEKYTLVYPDLAKHSAALRLADVDIYLYPMPFPFPFSVNSAAALCGIAKKIRNHPSFKGFANERRILELVFNGTATFDKECEKFISESLSQRITLPEIYTYQPVEEDDDEENEEGEY